MALTLKSRYWDDLKARQAFKRFILEIFGLDFTEWEMAGYWDYAYTPFSFFEGDAVVASACIYLLDAVVQGRNTRLAQISGVGTRPEFRRQGLSRELTERGLDWARGRHEGVFLFATDEAVPFYERCGFMSIEECVEVARVKPVPRSSGAVRLDPGCAPDRARIHEYAQRRAPISDRFSVLNARLLMFHALYLLRDCVYEIPDLECLVFCRREGGCLRLLDIVGAKVPGFEALYPFIADPGDREIEFHFGADKLGLDKTEYRPLEGNNPLVNNDFLIKKPVFPYTCRA